MRQTLVAGNWKLNGTRNSAVELAESVCAGLQNESCDVLVCPSFVHLSDVSAVISAAAENTRVRLGAQSCSVEQSGAYTGEVSADMLADSGCNYVIVGHSERRQLFADSDQLVAGRFAAVQAAGMKPILCVGETLQEREADQTEVVTGRQLDAVIDAVGIAAFADAVVAYEPVWAIGTGKSATPAQAQQVHAQLRKKIAQQDDAVAAGLTMLYGGSVKPANAADLFGQPDIDGGLIGGAALVADDFVAICKACAAIR